MEKIKGLAIELDMDHLSVDRGLKGLKDNIRTVNSEMRRNMSAFDRSDRSVKKYETSLMGLNKKLEVQKRVVAEAEKEYNKMVEEYGRGSKEAEKAAREYNNQAASLNNLERYIERTKKELADFERQQRIANSGWTKMGDKMQDYGGKLKGIGSQMDNVGSRMTRSITLPAVGAATAVGGIVAAFGWKRLTGLDSAQAQLKGLGYSTKEVGRISDQVTKAIDGGMTTMAEGTAVAAGALAAGVKEGKELERYIKLVGDAAVGANRPVEEMAQIFHRVQGAGKMMTQELNQIEHGMPGFSQAMAKHLGVPPEEMRKMVTEGKVTSKDFLDVMENFAGGMAAAYADSWDGMVANTKAYIGIIGENFLRGVFQDSKKSLADFIEMLKSPEIQQRAAEMGEVAREAFNKMKDSIMGVVDWYRNLDDSQKQMVHSLGLMVVAGGPALQLAGKLTSGLGSVLEVTGKLSKAIGVARGAGLVAGLASLGPGAIAGIAVAGLAAIGVGLYTLRKRSKEAEEVNLDVVESLTDEALALEKAANTFDKLSEKAKISNAELAELNDLNKRISESSNPGEIKELQKQYNALAEKSGLSKEELEKLFGANELIIEQSPKVEKSISDQGNEFAKSTDAVNEYVESLLETSRVELSNQRQIALENEEKLMKSIKKENEEIEGIEQRMQILDDASVLSKGEIADRIEEIELMQRGVLEADKSSNELSLEAIALKDIQSGKEHEARLMLQEQLTTKRESINASEEELEKIREMDWEYANILLKQVGINEQGEKGLANLDSSINKNEEELAKLDKKLEKNGNLTTEEQARYDKLVANTEKQREAKDIINEELGLYKDLNSLAEGRLAATDKETKKKVESLAKSTEIKNTEKDVVKQIQNKNSKIDESISKLEKEREKQGANKNEIDKQIKELEGKKSLNNAIIEQILKELGVWDDVKDSIDQGTKKEKEKGKATDDTTGKSKKQGDQIDKNNKKTDEGTKKEKERSKEAGRDVNKKVSLWETGLAAINRGATAGKSKRVSLWQVGLAAINAGASSGRSKKVSLWQSGLDAINRAASSPVSKVINFVGRGLSNLKFWEKGTPPSGHPGGDFVAGEKGEELVTLPSGLSFITPKTATFFPEMPKGTHVIPHRETKQILRNAPHYATGTSGWSDALGSSELSRLFTTYNRSKDTNVTVTNRNQSGGTNELLKVMLEQNKILMQLLNKDSDIHVDFDMDKFGRVIDKDQGKRINMSGRVSY